VPYHHNPNTLHVGTVLSSWIHAGTDVFLWPILPSRIYTGYTVPGGNLLLRHILSDTMSYWFVLPLWIHHPHILRFWFLLPNRINRSDPVLQWELLQHAFYHTSGV
jgi:hypothetical protein